MARTKEFDPEVALHAALELFWEQGYEATTMADLVQRLNISRASLYATFGGKRELYLRALDRYTERADPALLRTLSQPGPALPAIRGLVERYVREATGDARHRGCFIVNTAVELAAHDPLANRRVQASWDHLEIALTSALLRAQGQGELSEGADPRGLARLLLVLLQGVRVVGQAGSEPRRLRDAGQQVLALLA